MNRRMRCGLVAAGILLVACGSDTTTSDTTTSDTTTSDTTTTGDTTAPDATTPRAGGVLVVGLPGDITRTDSALIDDVNSAYVMSQVMQGLVGVAPGTSGDVIPVLAASLPAVSADGRTYTFRLREGVAFHDGTPFDCDAVKRNYDRWLSLPESYRENGLTYFIDVALAPAVASVTCHGSSEVAIELEAPSSSFLLTQTLVVFAIASPRALDDGRASSDDFADNAYAQGGPTAMTGTGPFRFESWVPGESVRLTRNAAYWDVEHAANLDGIEFVVIADSRQMLAELGRGDVDLVPTIAPDEAAEAAEDPALKVLDRSSSCNLFHLAMNHRHPPFDNVEIRRAVAHAVNKQGLIDAFYAGKAVPADNWMPPGIASHKPLHLPTYDPAKARALIAESGVTDLSFEFWYPSDVTRPYMPDPRGEFEAILADLEAVGFEPVAMTAPWRPDYLDSVAGGQLPMWLIGWNCDWASPDNFLDTAFFGYRMGSDGTFGPNEEYGYESDAMWQAMQNAKSASDPAQATEYWHQVQDILAADMPTVPLLSATVSAAARKPVMGFVPSATLAERFDGVWLDEPE